MRAKYRRFWRIFDLVRYSTLVVTGLTLIAAGLWPVLGQWVS